MLERDYILRMFQLLGQAVSRIVFFKETGKYDEALVEIDKAAAAVLGLNLEMLERMPVAGLRDMLGSDPSLLRSKFYAAGVLLKEKAELFEFQQQPDNAAVLYLKSLSLLIDDPSPLENREDDREVGSTDFVIGKLEEYELPPDLKRKLVSYYEATGRFGKAEDAVFEIVDEDPGYFPDGAAFYERLLLRTDDELARGGLPRSEIMDGLADLQRRARD